MDIKSSSMGLPRANQIRPFLPIFFCSPHGATTGTPFANDPFQTSGHWSPNIKKEGNQMKGTWLIGAAVLFACGLASESNEANAQGIHFGAGPVHVDVGNPHGGWYGGSYRSYYGGHGIHHRAYSQGHLDRGHSWHDTSHYDYHPGGFVRHRNHYHYVPGHYDYHQTGHWDHHH
jgi:hypothetical protein